MSTITTPPSQHKNILLTRKMLPRLARDKKEEAPADTRTGGRKRRGGSLQQPQLIPDSDGTPPLSQLLQPYTMIHMPPSRQQN